MQMWRGEQGQPIPDMPWAYHFDAGLYAAYLRRYAEAKGVNRIEGTVGTIALHSETGDIDTIVLDDGRTFDGEFFIDCTGFRSLLLGQALGAEFDDWSHWLPCDRAIAIPCKTTGDFTPYTSATAREAGWQWRIPLQHRVGNGHVYCSAYMGDDAALEILLANLAGAPIAEPNQLRFTTGMRRQQWHRNCLALGLAAGFLEPMESTSIHLIQSGIARFLQMLPESRYDPAMAREFNRQATFEWTRIRDFLLLHYHANGRHGEPFWDAMRMMELPDTLNAKIEQFRASGYIHREHEELFTEAGWVQVMIGQGVIPSRWNPIANTIPAADLAQMLQDIATRNADMVAQMPSHLDFLRAYIAPPETRKSA